MGYVVFVFLGLGLVELFGYRASLRVMWAQTGAEAAAGMDFSADPLNQEPALLGASSLFIINQLHRIM